MPRREENASRLTTTATLPSNRPDECDQEAALCLQEAREQAGHDEHEAHGDQQARHLDGQVVAGALEATGEDVHQLGRKDPHADADEREDDAPHERHLVDQQAGAFRVLLLVAQVPGHDERSESSRKEAEHQAGDHHADEEGVRLAGGAELARDDHLAGEADELAEERDHGDEHRRLGHRLLVQEAGQGRSA